MRATPAFLATVIAAVSLVASSTSRADIAGPLEREPPQQLRIAQATVAPTLNKRNRIRVQRALQALGYDVGEVDGGFRRRTRNAIKDYQRGRGETATGRLTLRQLNALLLEASAIASRQIEEAATVEDPNAIHGVIRGIVEGYAPAEELREQAGMAAVFAEDRAIANDLLRLPEAAAKDIGEPTLVKHPRHREQNRSASQLVFGVTYYSAEWIVALDDDHRKVLDMEAAARGRNTSLSASERPQAIALLKSTIARQDAAYGRDHPLTGFAHLDLAFLLQHDGETDAERRASQEEAGRHFDEAARLLGQPVEGSARLKRALREAAVSAYTSGKPWQTCGQRFPTSNETSETSGEIGDAFGRAAALHHATHGPKLEQVGWLRIAGFCARDDATRVRLIRARAALARAQGDVNGLISTHADLAVSYFHAGAKDEARRFFQGSDPPPSETSARYR